MKCIASGFRDLVGRTPMMRLNGYMSGQGMNCANVYAKLEYLNPSGSVKDRVALYMIECAERRGELKKGSVVIEPTSGNTGIGIAAVAASKGYRAILTLPENMSAERRSLLELYGAELVLTPADRGMAGAIEKAEELRKNIPASVIIGQFSSKDNPEAHRHSTGPEIWDDMDGNIDILVATVGTGGTITGCGGYLKSKIEGIKVVAVEPSASPVLSGGRPGLHKIQGIGAGFVPATLDVGIYDEVIAVSDEDAIYESKRFARTEGVLVGISSGAALKATSIIAARSEVRSKNIVVILPDSGDRYLSVFNADNMLDDVK